MESAPSEIIAAVPVMLDALPIPAVVLVPAQDPTGRLTTLQTFHANRAAESDPIPVTDPALIAACEEVLRTATPRRVTIADPVPRDVHVAPLPAGVLATWSAPAAHTDAAFSRRVLDNLFSFVGVLTPDGTLIEANRAPLEAAGIAFDDVRGLKFWDCFWWNYDPAVQGRLRDAVARAARGEIVRYDVPVRMAGDSRMWIDFQIAPLRDVTGCITHLIPSATDLTPRRAAEAELRDSEQRLQIARDAALLGIHDYNVLTGTVQWDARVRELFGVGPDEPITYEVFAAGVHPEDRARVDAVVARALDPAGTGRLEVEYRVVHRTDGQTRWVAATGRTFFEGGRAVRLVGTVQDISDRRRVEDARRRSEALLAAVLDSLPVAVGIADQTGRLVRMNPASRRIWGGTPLSADIAAYDDYTGLWPATGRRVRPEEWPLARAVIHGEVSTAVRIDIDRIGDRERRHLELHAAPVVGPDGEPLGGVVASMDVTERVRAERSLKESEERFRQLADAMPQLVWVADATGRVIYYNSRAAQYAGLRISTEGLWEWVPILHEDDRDATMSAWSRAVRTGESYQTEHRVGMADGSFRWHLSRAYRMGTGDEAQWYGTATDVHDLKAAQETLRESEARFRTMADGLSLPVWVHGPDGRQEFVNETYCEFFGVTREEMRDERWRVLTHPEDGVAYAEEFAACIRERRPFHAAVRARRADGRWRWIESWGRPRFSGTGEFLGIVGASADVTERREAEDELRRHRGRLEQLVEERTAELRESQARLRLSERMSALGTLSAGLGHDLGNILVPMRLWLEELERGDLPPQARDDVRALSQSADYLRSLASGLRLLSLDPEVPGAAPAQTTPAAWWREAAGVYKAALPRGIVLEDAAFDGLPPVMVPGHALTQMVFNLVQNAGDAMRERGRGRVWVEGAAGEGLVRLAVRDDGPGMSEEVRRRCTEPFFTTKARGRGTGIGLTVVYNLLQRYGGSMDVESAPGRGSRFVLSLPTPSGEPSRGLKAAVTVLDARTAAVMRSLLAARGVEVVPAGAAPPAVDLWVVDGSVPADAVARFAGAGDRRRVVRLGEAADLGPRVVGLAEAKPSAFREAIARAIGEATAGA